jgi:hypothetical protein
VRAEGSVGFDVGCEKVSKDRRDYPKRGGESLPLFMLYLPYPNKENPLAPFLFGR